MGEGVGGQGEETKVQSGSFVFYLTFTKQRWEKLGGAEAAAAC